MTSCYKDLWIVAAKSLEFLKKLKCVRFKLRPFCTQKKIPRIFRVGDCVDLLAKIHCAELLHDYSHINITSSWDRMDKRACFTLSLTSLQKI